MRDPRPKKAQGHAARPRGRGSRARKVNVQLPDGQLWKTVMLPEGVTVEKAQEVADRQGISVSDYTLALLGRAWRAVYGGGAK